MDSVVVVRRVDRRFARVIQDGSLERGKRMIPKGTHGVPFLPDAIQARW